MSPQCACICRCPIRLTHPLSLTLRHCGACRTGFHSRPLGAERSTLPPVPPRSGASMGADRP